MQRNIAIVVSILLVLLQACAVVRPPDGGPEDKEGPTAALSDSVHLRTNIRQRDFILLFSERVDRIRAQECISISPERRISFSWSGTSCTVHLEDTLEASTTYALSLGTDYTDANGNKPLAPLSAVFSTGDHLDAGSVRGSVIDEKPAGTIVMMYSLASLSDSVQPGMSKARYRTQVGTTGEFSFSAVPDGEYRLVALRDADGDGMYTRGIDACATLAYDPRIKDGTQVNCMIRMGTVEDRTPPLLQDIRPRSSSRVDILWSEPLDPATLTPTTFRISDTTGRDTLRILAVLQSPTSPTVWSLITDADASVAARRLTLASTAHAPRDTAGNRIADTLMRFDYTPENDVEEVRPGLVAVSVRDSTLITTLTPVITLRWNDAMDMRSLRDGTSSPAVRVQCRKAGVNVPVSVTIRDAAHIEFRATDTLASDSWYEFTIAINRFLSVRDVASADTALRLRLHTPDVRTYGTIKGFVLDTNAPRSIVVRLLRGQTEVRRCVLNEPGPFAFLSVPEGEYSIDVFEDADKDGRYSAGSLTPWTAAERFAPRRDKLMVRSRWTLDDVRFIIPSRP